MLGEGPAKALGRLVGKNRRRYGGYIVHVGIVSIFVGIAASSAFRIESTRPLRPGESMDVGRFTLRYDRIATEEDAHMSRVTALVSVMKNGEPLGMLGPEKRFYKKPQQPTTEVAIRPTLAEDLYLVLGSYDPASGVATIQAYVNPLVAWLWIGGLLMGIGTVITMWPTALERRAPAYALGGVEVPAE
jgi:cytochrome c-type biogenesis protein CcmF